MEHHPVGLDQVEEIDLRQYINVLLKWKWMIILLTIGCILTSYIVSTFFMTPIYETGTVLMVTQPNVERIYRQENGSLESTVDSFSRLPTLNLNTFISQFKNTEILNNVIKKLGLEEQGYTARTLADDITVTGDEKTNVLEVKASSPDPALAASIANTLVDEFYAFLFSSNQKQMEESVTYLTNQLQQTEAELKKASEMYQQGKSQARNSDVVEKELTSKMEIITDSKTMLLQSQVELEQLVAGKERLEENLANTPPKLVTKRAWTEDSTDGLIVDQTDQTQEAAEGASAFPKTNVVSEEVNPLYLELIKSLNQKDADIAQTRAKIAGLTRNISSLEKDIVQLQVELSEKQLEESTVKRKLDTLENAYAVLNAKIIETEIAQSVDFGRINLTVVSPAYHPSSPVKPNIQLNMAIAAILGVIGGVFLAFVLEFFDDTVKTEDDINRLVSSPVLGTIPTGR